MVFLALTRCRHFVASACVLSTQAGGR
jgi:hypothetical protein